MNLSQPKRRCVICFFFTQLLKRKKCLSTRLRYLPVFFLFDNKVHTIFLMILCKISEKYLHFYTTNKPILTMEFHLFGLQIRRNQQILFILCAKDGVMELKLSNQSNIIFVVTLT